MAAHIHASRTKPLPHDGIASSQTRLHVRIASELVQPVLASDVTKLVTTLARRMEFPHQLRPEAKGKIALNGFHKILDRKLRIVRLTARCLRAT
jgi:hypothetical protein